MKIEVVTGIGYGPTQLSAFDAAEIGMGLADSNLMYLSSVIPAGVAVQVLDGPTSLAGSWGNRVYAVLADHRTSVPGTEIWAGVGWAILDEDGRGLFAEHIGHTKAEVEHQIKASLTAFMTNRGLAPDESLIKMKLSGTTCKDQPACVLVAAVYQSQGWEQKKAGPLEAIRQLRQSGERIRA
jgi:arginine decarboxylase